MAPAFFDVTTLFENDDFLAGKPASRERLRDRYLDLWTAYEPADRLRDAFRLAEPLSMLHQVVSYRQIVASLEPGTERVMAGGLRFWARLLLRTLTDRP